MIGPCLTQGIRSHQTHGRVGNEAGTMGLKGYRAAIQGIGKLGEGGLVDEPSSGLITRGHRLNPCELTRKKTVFTKR